MTETIHDNPEFQIARRRFFSDFMLRHLDQAREWRESGLLAKEGSDSWKNVDRHQLLFSVMAQTIGELCELPPELIKKIEDESLVHDKDKRIQNETLTRQGVINSERAKKTRPLSATSTDFSEFADWGVEEYILRYCDSSIGEQTNNTVWYGTRNPNDLPPVIIVPWRERVAGFKKVKADEGELGRAEYGMTTWEKLEQVMEAVESILYEKIIDINPAFAYKYPDKTRLTELLEDRIHEKILTHPARA